MTSEEIKTPVATIDRGKLEAVLAFPRCLLVLCPFKLWRLRFDDEPSIFSQGRLQWFNKSPQDAVHLIKFTADLMEKKPPLTIEEFKPSRLLCLIGMHRDYNYKDLQDDVRSRPFPFGRHHLPDGIVSQPHGQAFEGSAHPLAHFLDTFTAVDGFFGPAEANCDADEIMLTQSGVAALKLQRSTSVHDFLRQHDIARSSTSTPSAPKPPLAAKMPTKMPVSSGAPNNRPS